VRFVLDENFDNTILRGVLRLYPEFDFVRAQDVPEMAGKDDPTLLAWAAEQERVLLTHDVRTVTKHAYERIAEGQPMPGVVEVKRGTPYAETIEDIIILADIGDPEELANKIIYLPLVK
jgi:hypothetical protein